MKANKPVTAHKKRKRKEKREKKQSEIRTVPGTGNWNKDGEKRREDEEKKTESVSLKE